MLLKEGLCFSLGQAKNSTEYEAIEKKVKASKKGILVHKNWILKAWVNKTLMLLKKMLKQLLDLLTLNWVNSLQQMNSTFKIILVLKF